MYNWKMIMENILIPCNTGVLLKFYDENPYREVEKTETGIIFNTKGAKQYKSHETGEYELNDELVACAQVIAVGPKCENVKVGEDVYCYKRYCIPVPYKNKKYYILSEQNITCRIVTERTVIPNSTDGKLYDLSCSETKFNEQIYSEKYVEFLKKQNND